MNDTKQENATGVPVKLFTGKNTHDATQYPISAYIYLYVSFYFTAAPSVDRARKRGPFNNTRNIMDTPMEIGNFGLKKLSCVPYLVLVLTFHI